MSKFTEANTIEKAIKERLCNLPELKWRFIHGNDLPRNSNEIFIEEWLKIALCKLNPEIEKEPNKADEVIYKLRGVLLESSNSGLVNANELFTQWITGSKSMPLGENGEHITINLVDFINSEKNDYVLSQQVPSSGAKNAFFDLVLYVNGIPLIVGEVKTPVRMSISWQDGASDFMGGNKHYWSNQSRFFVPNLLCFATEGKTFAYGPINGDFRDWMPWYKTTDGDNITQNMNTVLKSAESLLRPETILELIQSFSLFSTKKIKANNQARKIKILPRYPQYEASKQIVDRVKRGEKKKGLIWHFQGSGKSLLMLYAAKMLKADPELKNPTVIIVVDRVDLDSQINNTFSDADIKNVTPIRSCNLLSKELKNDSRNILVTTIFKFDDVVIDENNKEGLNPRKNIIVLVDEAHRTQEGMLGEKMRWALPNAFFFGLTGTPISGLMKNTFKLFKSDGDISSYINRYSYKQSIRDEATLPVKFEPRLVELRINQELIDKEFDLLSKANNLSDEEKNSLSQKAGKLSNLLKAPTRMEAVANDIKEHFLSHVNPKGLKAMVVVYDRQACVLMYNLLTKKLGPETCEIVMNISQGNIHKEDGKSIDQKLNTDWVKWKEQGIKIDKSDFKRWQLIDNNSNNQAQLLEKYRDPSSKLKILIVTAKLLTGFDAPICYCMYLDKPLKDHNLLQAICRTNRLYEQNKKNGLIIDYLGVFENLAKALSYDPKEIEGVVSELSKFKNDLPIILNRCLTYFKNIDRNIGGYEGLIAAQECIASNDKRDMFAAEFNILKKIWEALSPDKFLWQFKKDFCWLAQVYDSVRPVGGLGSLIWQSLGPEVITLIYENTDIDKIRMDIDDLVIDKDSIFTLTEAEQIKRAKKLEINLIAKVRLNSNDPRYLALGERLEKLREKYELGVLSSINWLKELLDAARETVNLDNTANNQNKIIDDNKTALTELFQEVRSDQTPEIIRSIVNDIDNIVKVTRFPGWQNTSSGDREMKQVLRKTLLKYKLHKDKDLFEKSYKYINEHY